MMNDKSIEIACEWWAEKLRNKVKHDNGDSGTISRRLCAFADMLSAPVNDERIDLFKNDLAKTMKGWFEKSDQYYHYLDVDYDPCGDLTDAAEAANISLFNFPYKTKMRIELSGLIAVKDGYGAPWNVIYDPDAPSKPSRLSE